MSYAGYIRISVDIRPPDEAFENTLPRLSLVLANTTAALKQEHSLEMASQA
jgi:hypothetical protein